MVTALQPGDPRTIGPYRIVGRLGRGGMGQVFLGRARGCGRVAVKVIRPEFAGDPRFRTRFAEEVAVARTVSGRFTAPVVDADLNAPAPWLATAYVPGPSLECAVTRRGHLSLPDVLALAARLAEGLGAIHAAGIVHRDLKPSNVLLARDGPRVIDFGISQAADALPLNGAAMGVGSPGFMSPEQAQGLAAGPPSDVFSLGAVLVFAATGAAPFGTGPSATLLRRVVRDRPGLDDLPAVLRPVAEGCLAKDPGSRPPVDWLLSALTAGPGGDRAGASSRWLASGREAETARPLTHGHTAALPGLTPTAAVPHSPAAGRRGRHRRAWSRWAPRWPAWLR